MTDELAFQRISFSFYIFINITKNKCMVRLRCRWLTKKNDASEKNKPNTSMKEIQIYTFCISVWSKKLNGLQGWLHTTLLWTNVFETVCAIPGSLVLLINCQEIEIIRALFCPGWKYFLLEGFLESILSDQPCHTQP